MTDANDGGAAAAGRGDPTRVVVEAIETAKLKRPLGAEAQEYLKRVAREQIQRQLQADVPVEERDFEDAVRETRRNLDRLVEAAGPGRAPLTARKIANTLATAGICPLWPFC